MCRRDRVRHFGMFRGGRSRSSLISYPPTICLSNLVRKLKTISSLKIRQEFFNQIRRMLWGKRFWTKSYFLISVRNGATTAIIKRYIKINGRIDIRPSAIHPRAYARGIPRNLLKDCRHRHAVKVYQSLKFCCPRLTNSMIFKIFLTCSVGCLE